MIKSPARGEDQRQGGSKLRWRYLPILASLVSLGAIGAIPFVAGQPEQQPEQQPATDLPSATPAAVTTSPSNTPFAQAPALKKRTIDAEAAQATYLNLATGEHRGTYSERFARPALSLSKLYIADYVLKKGTKAQREQALVMLKNSDDAIAETLFNAYPNSITETAKTYGLASTFSEGRWGYSYTSSFDAVKYLATVIEKEPSSPILEALSQAYPKAADGTRQNFGTAVMEGVQGTKWGWSDDKTLHSSVSFGQNDGQWFVVAAAVSGSAAELTEFVQAQL
ncbi:hypothetical protein NQ015_09545 [Corynebacterium sp. 153RC1]|uniref:hypothetical protein n=1 Tax=unclassified Corynebacterium TaxID=2624378 RepID=UPI00211C2B1A|nr:MULTISPECIES: hypothetical protein [unclassified Corynebacterium]MCQ9353352.1 hypothetical protein [Corynebacterium sp. 209RC1]MCQ9355523.1 hypothetical protein [Corynebacterium sp. 1222RC1]MCQ9357660.1 hypothetical protein [Corynebacterium sp. 122RC1]MCQ9359867.1 hypothetical protein [Corynebacterium sp. 142RC1]MCQ9361996.1 hypothetical protein [Corynebacterium sp. 153RC1]